MKKLTLSIVLASSLLAGSTATKQDCIENFQNEILTILHKDAPQSDKEKALNDINKNMIEKCDTLPENKTTMKNRESEECIEKFESDIMDIMNNTPEPTEKKKALQEVLKSYKQKCE